MPYFPSLNYVNGPLTVTGVVSIQNASVGTLYMGSAYNGLVVGKCGVNYGQDALIAGPGGVQFSNNSVDDRDLALLRDAANTLAQRNGVNAQAFRIYNTFTDASNYERMVVGVQSGVFQIRTEFAGTGTAKELVLNPAAGARLRFATDGTTRWNIAAGTGHFIAEADNTYDIGNSGTLRPRTVYAATSVVAPLVTTTTTTVGALGSASPAGQRKFVTDANATTFASIVAAGGANGVPVYSDGTNWRIG